MRILCYILVVLFATTSAVGQQINPVPDYIFRNSMSVGRNAPTDTAAYFSIGPRFGATRGFMPPMVIDTAAVTGTKRNGLLIYSIQRNSFLYWDSTGSRWSRIAANLDTLQLATRAWRQKGDDSLAAIINTRTDTLLLSTRAWRQKGIDSVASVRIGGSGVTGYIPKFTATRTLDSSQIFQLNGNIGIGTATPEYKLDILSTERIRLRNTSTSASAFSLLQMENNATNTLQIFLRSSTASNPNEALIQQNNNGQLTFQTVTTNPILFNTSTTERMRIHGNGRVTVNTSADNGYQLDVAGSLRSTTMDVTGILRNTTDAYFNTTSGNVGINTVSPVSQLHLVQRGNTIADGITLSRPGSSRASFFIDSTTNTLNLTRGGTGVGTGITIFSNNRVAVNTSTDGGYQFAVAGSISTSADINFGGDNLITSNGRTFLNMGTSGTGRMYSQGSATAIQFYPNNTLQMSIEDGGEVWMGYTTDQGAFRLQLNGNALINGNIRTAAPAGGTANDWRLGTVATVTPTSPNRTIEVSIGGTIYYIHAKTTND